MYFKQVATSLKKCDQIEILEIGGQTKELSRTHN